MIQLYSPLGAYGSFCNVGRAIATELRRHRVDAAVYPIGDKTLTKVDCPLPIAFDSGACVGVYVGYPEGGVGWLAGHNERIMVTVCETDRLPQSWVDSCNEATLIVVPSEWCRTAFRRSGVHTPVEVVPHGVWPLREALEIEPRKESLTLLHVSGSLSFAARKSTGAVLRAFKAFVAKNMDARLWLKVPHTAGLQRALDEVDLNDHVDILPSETWAPARMAALYRRAHAVVQPSRAEGFGLVPLEARAQGVPVIVTHCTGHLEHADEHDVVVEHGRSTPLETESNPVGAAPTVTVDAVTRALEQFEADLYTARRQAEVQVRGRKYDKWRWEHVLAPLVRLLRKRDERKHVRLGGSVSLRGTT